MILATLTNVWPERFANLPSCNRRGVACCATDKRQLAAEAGAGVAGVGNVRRGICLTNDPQLDN